MYLALLYGDHPAYVAIKIAKNKKIYILNFLFLLKYNL